MAAYNTITKIFVGEVSSTEDSTIDNSLAKTINDYIETLDDGTGAIISMSSTAYGGTSNVNTGRLFVTLVHKG
jgi:D-lyxose ketol-isomerase